jgi:hypothetical protein
VGSSDAHNARKDRPPQSKNPHPARGLAIGPPRGHSASRASLAGMTPFLLLLLALVLVVLPIWVIGKIIALQSQNDRLALLIVGLLSVVAKLRPKPPAA